MGKVPTTDDISAIVGFLTSHMEMEEAEAVAAVVYCELEQAVLAARAEAMDRSKKRKLDADKTM